MEKKIDLTPQPLKRPLDRSAMGNDAMQLRALTAMMNNPVLTGAEIPPEEKPPVAQCVPIPGVAAPKAAAAADLPRRIFFTGLPRVGKSWLGDQLAARVFEFDDPIRGIAFQLFGTVRDPKDLDRFAAEVQAWGDGEVSERFPITATRAMFVDYVRNSGGVGRTIMGIPVEDYGTAGFWSRSLLARVAEFEEAFPMGHLVVVTNVTTKPQYDDLRQADFRPYHVSCSEITRSSRGGKPVMGTIAESVERSITQKISQKPHGSKLWAVWDDPQYPPPSSRYMTIKEFFSLWAE
jgi:hypothetical protein